MDKQKPTRFLLTIQTRDGDAWYNEVSEVIALDSFIGASREVTCMDDHYGARVSLIKLLPDDPR
jgi:hypothetical protein